jgi:hypothetical protein
MTMAEADISAEGLGDASPEGFAVGAMDGVEYAMASEESVDTFGRCQPTLLGIPQELRDKIVRAHGVAKEHE